MATVVLTGANKGIGLAIAKVFVKRTDEVNATCRSISSFLEKTGAEIFDAVDVTKESDVDNSAKEFGNRKIDKRINNAGVALRSDDDKQDWPAMLFQFNVNALDHYE